MAPEDDNPLAGLDVQLESTAEQVAGALREAIIDGGLAQGTYLREDSLSKRFNVSRNTIREATQILVGERLVTRRMHRGAFVSRLGAEDVHDLYRVRRIVELPAVGEAATMDPPRCTRRSRVRAGDRGRRPSRGSSPPTSSFTARSSRR